MREVARALGAALWMTLVLAAGDLARAPKEEVAAVHGWSFLRHGVELGLLTYGVASLALVGTCAVAARLLRRRLPAAASESGTALPLYAGALAATGVGAYALGALGERQGGPAWASAGWLLDAQIIAAGSLVAGWGAAVSVRAARSTSRLVILAMVAFLPAFIASMPVIASLSIRPAARKEVSDRAELPDIVLIVADSLRADALSCYGHPTLPTPQLDALSATGARFADATAQASRSSSATASIFTSRLPSDHGVGDDNGVLRGDGRTLAEILASHGYETAGIVGSLSVSSRQGVDRGFDEWDQDPSPDLLGRYPYLLPARLLRAVGRSRPQPQDRPASLLVDRALAFLSKGARAPRFLYLNPSDPRDPYAPTEAFARAADPNYKGSFKLAPRTLQTILRGEQEASEEDLRHARALYAAEVASMDRELGRLFDAVRQGSESGRTILVFTSDHGEEFLEHDALGHGHTLYQELIHVPLLVVHRGVVRSGAVIREPVSHLDIAPTILALAGLPSEPSFTGRNLGTLLNGSAAGLAESEILGEENLFGTRTTSHRIRMARRGAWKVILYSPDVFGIGAWRREAFNLEIDPAERESLPSGTGEVDRLEDSLRARVAREDAGHPPAGKPAPEVDHVAGSPEEGP